MNWTWQDVSEFVGSGIPELIGVFAGFALGILWEGRQERNRQGRLAMRVRGALLAHAVTNLNNVSELMECVVSWRNLKWRSGNTPLAGFRPRAEGFRIVSTSDLLAPFTKAEIAHIVAIPDTLEHLAEELAEWRADVAAGERSTGKDTDARNVQIKGDHLLLQCRQVGVNLMELAIHLALNVDEGGLVDTHARHVAGVVKSTIAEAGGPEEAGCALWSSDANRRPGDDRTFPGYVWVDDARRAPAVIVLGPPPQLKRHAFLE